jgi:hypothetical protein
MLFLPSPLHSRALDDDHDTWAVPTDAGAQSLRLPRLLHATPSRVTCESQRHQERCTALHSLGATATLTAHSTIT